MSDELVEVLREQLRLAQSMVAREIRKNMRLQATIDRLTEERDEYHEVLSDLEKGKLQVPNFERYAMYKIKSCLSNYRSNEDD